MAVNEMTFEQSAVILNDIQNQVTGVKNPAAVDTKDFVSIATTVLAAGNDPVMNAINQVLSRTIFSIRPYSAKFRLAEITETAFGNHTRKLKVADKPIVEDERYKWPVAYDVNGDPANGDGNSVDMYKIRKPDVIQTNFYGSQVFEDHYTIFKDQLDSAFSNPAELSRFWQMITLNTSNKLTQYRENAGRLTVLNFIGGILAEADVATSYNALGHRVIPLITLYNAMTGENVTIADVFGPDNMRPFVQFVYSTIKTVSSMMEERSILYQTVVNGKNVNQHTPKISQKLMILEQFKSMFEMMGLSNTYHDGYLILPGGVRTEIVGYWQNIKKPWEIQVNPSRINSSGTITASTMETARPIVATLFDEEALGYATTQSWQAPTPLNAAGGYWNMFVHETERIYNDHSEKGVVFTLE